ncbi:Polygalacturonase QRT3 [Spatholobus suberectus]|nr:Polygalacturonase QRT3 [Spatholobus suberectus]
MAISFRHPCLYKGSWGTCRESERQPIQKRIKGKHLKEGEQHSYIYHFNACSGRVVYPVEYGADPTGAQESSDAILKAVGDAFGLESGLEMLAGVRDLGGVVIDLQGGNYTISKPITFPSSGGGNVVVKGGTLRATDSFPTDRHLVELRASNSQKLPKTSVFSSMKLQQPNGIYYEDITFRDILFDSGYRGGGIFVVDSARIRINNCFFLHFTTEGILVQGGHETFISSCFLGQHSTVGGDKGRGTSLALPLILPA